MLWKLEVFVQKVSDLSVRVNNLSLSFQFHTFSKQLLHPTKGDSGGEIIFGTGKQCSFEFAQDASCLPRSVRFDVFDGNSQIGSALVPVGVGNTIPCGCRILAGTSQVGVLFAHANLCQVQACDQRPVVVRVVSNSNSKPRHGSFNPNVAKRHTLLHVLHYDIHCQLSSICDHVLSILKRDCTKLEQVAVPKGNSLIQNVEKTVTSIVRSINIVVQLIRDMVPEATSSSATRPNKLSTPKQDSMAQFLQFEVLYQLQSLANLLHDLVVGAREQLEMPLSSFHRQHQKVFRTLAKEVGGMSRLVNIIAQAAADGLFGKTDHQEETYSDDCTSQSSDSTSQSLSDEEQIVSNAPSRPVNSSPKKGLPQTSGSQSQPVHQATLQPVSSGQAVPAAAHQPTHTVAHPQIAAQPTTQPAVTQASPQHLAVQQPSQPLTAPLSTQQAMQPPVQQSTAQPFAVVQPLAVQSTIQPVAVLSSQQPTAQPSTVQPTIQPVQSAIQPAIIPSTQPLAVQPTSAQPNTVQSTIQPVAVLSVQQPTAQPNTVQSAIQPVIMPSTQPLAVQQPIQPQPLHSSSVQSAQTLPTK